MQPMTIRSLSSRTLTSTGIMILFWLCSAILLIKKVHNNLANGGFASFSEMGQFLPYSLDPYFSLPDVVLKKFTNGEQVRE